jgi:hypothetical protein
MSVQMQEPTNRDREKTAFTVLKILIGCGLFSIVMCAGLVFFLYGLCKSGKFKVEAPRPAAPAVRLVHSTSGTQSADAVFSFAA